MDRIHLKPLVLAAAALCASGLAAAQGDNVYRVSPMGSRWAFNDDEGRCHLRVRVDDRAQVRLRGDQVIVNTLSGRRSYDEGSVCNQPLPSHPVENFRVTLEQGRGRVVDVDSPHPSNDFGGAVTVEDPQPGGDDYDLIVAWRNPAGFGAPLAANEPVFDDLNACQERVRHQFLGNNDSGQAFIEFRGIADRDDAGPYRERIHGEAWARNRDESRRVSYECLLNPRTNRVITASYDLLGPRRYSSLY